ncbi:FliM/FliN family flagellar motor switch protein [Variovorax sp. RHLX14]|uniref:FliM/FliN family flagellar motor switch protein n=1 Tax=Variovorax sp. RHLX14 TaxID=1259731 RepID=UPI003F48BE7E
MRDGRAPHGDASRHGATQNAAWTRTHVSADAARLSRTIGHGRRIALETPGRLSYIEVLTPAMFASHAESEKVADAMRGTVLDGREGQLILGSGGLALLCLLGGVPWPVGGGAARERLHAAAALARLPSPLAELDFSLARVQAPSLSPVYRILASVSKARAARHEALVRQRLHVRSDDISCYCEAWAPARVWDAAMRLAEPHIASAAALQMSAIPLRFGFSLGCTRAPRSELALLQPGDIVRMPLWLDASGIGLVSIAGLAIGVRCTGPERNRLFSITSVEPAALVAGIDFPSPFALRAFTDPPRPAAMNPLSSSTNEVSAAPPGEVVVPADATPPGPLGNDLTELLDTMPVTLAAEVGLLRLTVATLRGLAPGMLLEIEPHALGEVVLRTEEGRHLAGGRLVDIDGQLGIQVTQLGSL